MAQATVQSVGILNMYNGTPNQGMRCIKCLVEQAGLPYTIYDVRGQNQLPSVEDHQLFIGTGGPGDPNECRHTEWGARFKHFLEALLLHNQQSIAKKPAFLICHSYQMACIALGLGDPVERDDTSFGIFPVYKTPHGEGEHLFQYLDSPFQVIDSRDYEIVDLDFDRMQQLDTKVLAFEQARGAQKRAVMAIRFSREVIGTQFHPEADPDSMHFYVNHPEKVEEMIEVHGLLRIHAIRKQLADTEALNRTFHTVLPSFLQTAKTYQEQMAG